MHKEVETVSASLNITGPVEQESRAFIEVDYPNYILAVCVKIYLSASVMSIKQSANLRMPCTAELKSKRDNFRLSKCSQNEH